MAGEVLWKLELEPSTGLYLQTTTTMAESNSRAQRPLLTQEQLKKKLAVSNFDPNAILRGAQLTVVGGQLLYLDGQPKCPWLTTSKP